MCRKRKEVNKFVMAEKVVIYTVILRIYSGRENPKWTVDSTHPKYDAFEAEMSSVSSAEIPSRLGYTGFTVIKKYENKTNKGTPERNIVHILDKADAALQWFLFNTMPEENKKESIRTEIERVIGPQPHSKCN